MFKGPLTAAVAWSRSRTAI